MVELGLEAPNETIGNIFDSVDRDRSGTIQYEELSRAGLRAKAARIASEGAAEPWDYWTEGAKNRRKAEARRANANLFQDADIDEDSLDTIPDQVS